MGIVRHVIIAGLGLFVAIRSIGPVRNLLRKHQAMNASFDPLHLVNTYGAFGSVTRERYEIIIEGTSDERPGPHAKWQAYEFRAKPGDVRRRPPLIAPYQPHLDWQMWFAAMSPYWANPWVLHLVAKLLAGDKAVLKLFRHNPFPVAPPKFIRAELYLYQFAPLKESGVYWQRQLADEFLPALSLDDPSLRRALSKMGWTEQPPGDAPEGE